MDLQDERRTPTVVHVFGAMDRGGAELRTIEVAHALPASAVRMIYVTLSGREGELADLIRQRGDDVVPLRLGLLFVVEFARILFTRRADAVHSHVATFSGVPLLVAMLVGVRTRIAHFRSDGDQHGNALRRKLQRSVMRALIALSATHIIGVSPGALTFGWRPDWERDPRCRIIANGIAVERLPSDVERSERRRQLGVGASTRVLCHVGKSDANKNRTLAVQLACAFARDDPDVELWLVGPISSAEQEALCEIATQQGKAEILRVLGTRSDVPQLLNAADVTLLTSKQEGLPGVVLESLAVGTVVLASDLPGCRWIGEALSGVMLVEVDAPLAKWLSKLVDAIADGRRDGNREAVRDGFAKGPFLLTRSTEMLYRIWRGR